MIRAPGITVNGVNIPIEMINAEVQYHPAESLTEAKHAAMQALVVRELLVQQAIRHGICTRDSVAGHEDDIIAELLKHEIQVPKPDDDECKRYYHNNRDAFTSSPIFEVAHILYLAPPEDAQARATAREKADAALCRLAKRPDAFAELARQESACPSGQQGGNLGQISRGQTVPAFEAALMKMNAGEIAALPVETEFGFHVVRLDRFIAGELLPFDAVAASVAAMLRQRTWQRACSQYIQLLAAEADISGFSLKHADSPLVQ